MLQSYRGMVNTWECDEVGHMNVRFYVARSSDAAFYTRAAMGLTPSVIRNKQLAVIALEEHFRFHRELRAGEIYTVHSVFTELDKRTARVFHEIRNTAKNEVAATIYATVALFDLKTRKTLPWTAPMRAGALEHQGVVPDYARPRSVPLGKNLPEISLEDPQIQDFPEIYRGAVQPWECDEFDHMNAQFYMARFSDGAAHLWHHIGFDRTTMQARHQGTAVLEMRLNYLRELRAGDMVVIKSAVQAVENKVLKVAHFMFNAETGILAATSEVAAVLLDLEARKALLLKDSNPGLTRHIHPV